MDATEFINLLTAEVSSYKNDLEVSDKSNEWIVKGFIDINKHIYSITSDTKVVSKLIEILLIPRLNVFAEKNNLSLELPSKQNFYPDLTFVDKTDSSIKFAVDFKSSYYENNVVNGMTLGSYWGYFRERNKCKNTDYPYGSYKAHIVLGMLYKQNNEIDEDALNRKVFTVDDLDSIKSVIKDFIFFVQPKWKIASDQAGSGNTRNIGGITKLDDLINGKGPFTAFQDGECVFDHYWSHFYNKQDATKCKIPASDVYNNIKTYKEYLNRQIEANNNTLSLTSDNKQ